MKVREANEGSAVVVNHHDQAHDKAVSIDSSISLHNLCSPEKNEGSEIQGR